MSAEVLATLAIYIIKLIEFGMQRDEVIDTVRDMEKSGRSAAEVTAYLKELADKKIDELNALPLRPSS